MRNILLAISGPSGVGKGTLVRLLMKEDKNLVTSVSCTTRAPRAGEVDGRDYFFLSKEEFSRRIQERDFLEYDEHFGNFYGTPRSFVEEQLKEKSVILEIDVVGALNAKKLLPQTVLIMIAPPSLKVLCARLSGRGSESEEQVKERLQRVEYELKKQNEYDYVVVNDDLQLAKKRLQEIILAERNK